MRAENREEEAPEIIQQKMSPRIVQREHYVGKARVIIVKIRDTALVAWGGGAALPTWWVQELQAWKGVIKKKIYAPPM